MLLICLYLFKEIVSGLCVKCKLEPETDDRNYNRHKKIFEIHSLFSFGMQFLSSNLNMMVEMLFVQNRCFLWHWPMCVCAGNPIWVCVCVCLNAGQCTGICVCVCPKVVVVGHRPFNLMRVCSVCLTGAQIHVVQTEQHIITNHFRKAQNQTQTCTPTLA